MRTAEESCAVLELAGTSLRVEGGESILDHWIRVRKVTIEVNPPPE